MGEGGVREEGGVEMRGNERNAHLSHLPVMTFFLSLKVVQIQIQSRGHNPW